MKRSFGKENRIANRAIKETPEKKFYCKRLRFYCNLCWTFMTTAVKQ